MIMTGYFHPSQSKWFFFSALTRSTGKCPAGVGVIVATLTGLFGLSSFGSPSDVWAKPGSRQPMVRASDQSDQAPPAASGQATHQDQSQQDPAEGMAALPAPQQTLNLWPDTPPGDKELDLPPESDTSGPDSNRVAGKYVIRLGNVSTPQIAIYRPEPELDTGRSIVICPGGGYHILAYDLEGTEVAQWLNRQGITGIVLKYRVPAREDQPRWLAAVQDTQRAISLVRQHATEWKLNPQSIGVLGFSAGGHAAGMASLLQNNRKYDAIDDVDEFSCAPNYAILVYPAYLFNPETGKMQEGLTIPESMGPMFLVHAQDDPVTPLTSLGLATELKKHDIPVEMHLYHQGGHGYGLRKTELPVTHWTDRCESWLEAIQK